MERLEGGKGVHHAGRYDGFEILKGACGLMGEIGVLTKDEQELVYEYRRVKAMRHGDLNVSIKNNEMVKLWITTTRKVDLEEIRGVKKLTEVEDDKTGT